MDDVKISSNRSFGIVFFSIFLIISLYPLINGESLRVEALIISLVFLFLAILNSRALTSLNIIWFKFGIFLSKYFSPLIMGIIFFLIVTPIGLIMRFFKKDLLNLKFNQDKSYWILKTDIKSKMKNQF